MADDKTLDKVPEGVLGPSGDVPVYRPSKIWLLELNSPEHMSI